MPLLSLLKAPVRDLEKPSQQSFLFWLNQVIDKINDYHRDAELEGCNVYMGPNGLATDPKWTENLADITTTDATETTLETIPITASRTYFIESRVVARRTGGTAGTAEDGAVFVLRSAYNTITGTVTLIPQRSGFGASDFAAINQQGWTAKFDISSTNVRVRVIGATNNNISWHARTTVEWVNA